jgi:hypothetical protein
MTAPGTPPCEGIAAVLVRLAEAEQKIAALEAAQDTAAKASKDGSGDGESEAYQPSPAPRLWEMTAEERRDLTAHLRAWVGEVFRPGYGHLAGLGDCWERHDLCLYLLDWLSEMHSFLYQDGERGWGVLAGQADWHTRFLPTVVAQLEEETHNCDHLPVRRPR